MNKEIIKQIIIDTINGEEHLGENLKKQCIEYIKELMENKKYKEVIDKAIKLNKQVIKDTKEFYRPTKDIIYSGDTLIDIAEQNLKILKEVE